MARGKKYLEIGVVNTKGHPDDGKISIHILEEVGGFQPKAMSYQFESREEILKFIEKLNSIANPPVKNACRFGGYHMTHDKSRLG